MQEFGFFELPTLPRFHSHKHRGVVHLGDQVCFVRELGEKRSSKERYAYLALEPTADGTMELVVERREVSESCSWTLLHADGDVGAPLQSHMPLLIRGKYNDCLAVGSPLRGVSPARASGRHLLCKGRDGRVPELRFRIVKAGIALDARDIAGVEKMEYPSPAVLTDGDLGQKTLGLQEQMLLDDLLFCLQGVEGAYIHRAEKTEGAHFNIEIPAGADASTAQFLQQMMPLCDHHAFVEMFVERQSKHEYGAVNHALCSALGELLREFAMKVSSLEQSLHQGDLTLAELWYRSQPSMDTFALLYRITSHVQGLKGGAVLNGIEEVMMKTGLTSAQALCEFLLQKACRPYFDMMSLWVYEGRLQDPYNEFFVSENFRRDEQTKRTGPAADFWQKHFTIDERAVPQFLASSRERILHAGKYLHVFFSASPNASLPEPLGGRVLFQYSRKRRDYAEAIDSAYRRSATALLNLFMRPQPEGLDLPGRLKSLRSFFFLSKADWFGHFLDTAELERPAEEVPLARLDGLLDLAVRASSMAADPFREDISCGLHSFRVEDACHRMVKGSHEEEKEDAASVASGISTPSGLGVAGEGSGVRSLTLKYRTAWPLSILFSKTILLKYQVIFRHLLYCRYVERKLVEVWVDHQYTKELGLDSSFSPYYSLRQRMLHFCRDYIYYVTVEVLEPQSHEFLTSLSGAETIDDVLYRHEQFLEGCLREILLTEHDNLYRHLSKVLQTCLTFAHNLRRFSHSIGGEPIEEPDDGKTPAERRLTRVRHSTQKYLALLSQRHYSKMMAKWKTIFENQLQAFLRQIQQETKARYEHFLKNLATRLDYNEYYSTVLTSGFKIYKTDRPRLAVGRSKRFGVMASPSSLQDALAEAACEYEASPALFPMYTVPLQKLMDMVKVRPHEELQRDDVLSIFDQKMGRAAFVSHQWITPEHPDPEGKQLKVLQDALGNMIREETTIQPCVIQGAYFQSTGLSTQILRSRPLFIWYDYFSVPQGKAPWPTWVYQLIQNGDKALQSIPAYIDRSEIFLELCPMIADGSQIFGPSTWASRGWCRTEALMRLVSPKPQVVMIKSGKVWETQEGPFAASYVSPGEGVFGLNEDKRQVQKIISERMRRLLLHCLKVKDLVSYRMYLNLEKVMFRGFGKVPSMADVLPCPSNPSSPVSPSSPRDPFLQLNFFRKVTEVDAFGFSPLCYAALNGDPEILESLLEASANPNFQTRAANPLLNTGPGITALGLAAWFGHREAVQKLLSARADVHLGLLSPLDFAACGGQVQMIQDLCQAGSRVNAVCLGGATPINWASLHSLKDAAAELISAGAEPSQSLHFAGIHGGTAGLVVQLMEARADVNEPWKPHRALKWVFWFHSLSSCFRNRKTSILLQLAYHCWDATPLMVALICGNDEVATSLIKAKAQLDLQNQRGWTAIDFARERSPDLLQMLEDLKPN